MIAPGMFLSSLPCLGRSFCLAAGLLAAPKFQWDSRLVIYSLCIVAILLLGAFVIACVNRWRRNSDTNGLSPSDQLTQYRSLYEEGEISQEEFERLRALLGRRIRSELDVPAARSAQEADGRTGVKTGRPSDPTHPQNPSGSSDPPDSGIRPA
jgi:uncharacterized membrane protein